MQRRTRHVIAVMVVATALCADRATAAAPQSAPQSTGLAKTLVKKLTSSLRQSVSPAQVQPVRAIETARPMPLIIRQEATGIRSDFSPFQFRLPPPSR